MKPLVIYHANCADGFGAAFAAWLKLGDEAEYVPCSHGEDGLRADLRYGCTIKGRDVYILDFSFDKDLMNFYFANAKRVVWLDHHKTAFEMWCGEYKKGMRYAVDLIEASNLNDDAHYIDLNDNKSGALIAWEYFHPLVNVPELIYHIDDYDRWQFKLDGTKKINKAIWSHAPWGFQQWKWWLEDGEDALIQLEAQGEAILRAHNQNVQSVVKGSVGACKIVADIGTFGRVFTGLAANCPPHLTSDVGHELANQSSTFGLCWTLSQEGLIAKCSLRSNGEYDVSAIAKAFGGGGHRNAAGFEVPLETLIGWLSS